MEAIGAFTFGLLQNTRRHSFLQAGEFPGTFSGIFPIMGKHLYDNKLADRQGNS
jgi:hypothetical protein